MSGQILVAVALTLVFFILVAGLYAVLKNGQAPRTRSNRLMRYRILAQFVAILIIGVVLYFGAR